MFAMVMHHLKVGAQKWMVKGPACCCYRGVIVCYEVVEGG